MSYKIDLTNPENLSNKVLPEDETKKRILQFARERGCEYDVKRIYEKYEKLLKNCTNAKEREAISSMGCVEIYRYLGSGGQLYVNGQLIVDDTSK